MKKWSSYTKNNETSHTSPWFLCVTCSNSTWFELFIEFVKDLPFFLECHRNERSTRIVNEKVNRGKCDLRHLVKFLKKLYQVAFRPVVWCKLLVLI